MARELSREQQRVLAVQMEAEALIALATLRAQQTSIISDSLAQTWMRSTANRIVQHTSLATPKHILRDVRILHRAQWLAEEAAYRQEVLGLASPQHPCWARPEAADSRLFIKDVNTMIAAEDLDAVSMTSHASRLKEEALSVVFGSRPSDRQPFLVVENLRRSGESESAPSNRDVIAITEGQARHVQLLGSPWLAKTINQLHRDSLTNSEDSAGNPLTGIRGLRKVDARLRTRWVCEEADIQGVVGISPRELGGALYTELRRTDPAVVAPVLDWVWRERPGRVPSVPELNDSAEAKTWWNATNDAFHSPRASRA